MQYENLSSGTACSCDNQCGDEDTTKPYCGDYGRRQGVIASNRFLNSWVTPEGYSCGWLRSNESILYLYYYEA